MDKHRVCLQTVMAQNTEYKCISGFVVLVSFAVKSRQLPDW